MRARAPGKLVLSGSYSVLWGAPALVGAVDGFALAAGAREPVHVADEVTAAVKLGMIDRPCFVDASALRTAEAGGGSRKLGLGSSAAILVATLVAKRGAPRNDSERRALFEDALRAHREAQGGGSGIDVAASTWGGVVRFEIAGGTPVVTPHALPEGVIVTVFACDTPVVTASFVKSVRAFASESPARFDPLIGRAREGALAACDARDARAFCGGLEAQRLALAEIGDGAGVAIVTPPMRELAGVAAREGAVFLPSGAGGGDVALFVASSRPSDAFVVAARERALVLLDVLLGAPGAEVMEGAR